MKSKRTTLPHQTLRARQAKAFRDARKQNKVHALAISHVPDVSYLSGFSGDDSILLIGPDWGVLVTDGRYDEQARQECASIDIHIRRGKMTDAIAEALTGRSVRSVGVQADHCTLALRDALDSALGSRRIVPLNSFVPTQRQCKDRHELPHLRKAVKIAQDALTELLAGGARSLLGRTEADIAGQLDYLMRQHGACGSAFTTIVAAGANGSRPHHEPGPTVVKNNQPLLFDWGARVNGYCSDLTRVCFLGTIPPELKEIYPVVAAAQAAAIRAIRPGVALRTVDQAARDVITEAGFGETFNHGTGHGIGLEIHEAPGVNRLAKGRVKKGMVVTVEPGIYLPGIGGIRIEDDVLVTGSGRKKLSTLPADIEHWILK